MGIPHDSIIRNVRDHFIPSAATACPARTPADGMALCIHHDPPRFLRGWQLQSTVLSRAGEGDVGRRIQRDKCELPISADSCERRYTHFNDCAAPTG